MTTVIVSDSEAACDSLWTYTDGSKAESNIHKYLYLSGYAIEGYTPDPFIVFYSGTYRQIVLHQALMLNLIDSTVYMTVSNWLSDRGENRLEYIQIRIIDWNITSEFNIGSKNQVRYAGSGGGYAADYYPNCYNVYTCVSHAISLDSLSGPDVSHFSRDGKQQVHIIEVTQVMYDTLYIEVEGIVQSYKEEKNMPIEIKQTAPDGKEINRTELEGAISNSIKNIKKEENVSTLWINNKNAKKKENIIKKKGKITL